MIFIHQNHPEFKNLKNGYNSRGDVLSGHLQVGVKFGFL